MIAYAIYTDYTTWLGGRTPVLTSTDFSFYALAATFKIYSATFGNIPNTIPENVKQCTCALAEEIYKLEQRKGISSENNDGYSISYDTTVTADGVIEDIIRTMLVDYNLADTNLLYRGLN